MSSLPVPPPTNAKSAPGQASPVHPTPGRGGKDRCEKCGQPVEHWYFRVNGAMHCLPCAKSARNFGTKHNETASTRAFLFGMSAALAGILVYSVFGIVTGWMLGYFTFAMAAIIAKMMMIGSKGMGGRRYQWTALVLTYATVSLSAVPIAVVYESRRQAAIRAQNKPANLAEEQRRLEEEFGGNASRPVPHSSQPATSQKNPQNSDESTSARPSGPVFRPTPNVSPVAVLGSLVLLGLFSPFLALAMPIQGGIQLIILAVSMIIAWRMTAGRRTEITGPFRT
jgi:hypothetical protein